MDWGTGEYERTARAIEPVSVVVIDALAPSTGDRVLDVACGTGNAALIAAKRGAETVGVDASARLLDVAAQRARSEALTAEWEVADVEELPFEDDSFDGVVSVFGVIFAADALKAAAELKRVTKPGGTIVISSWLPRGPVGDLMAHVSQVVAEYSPQEIDADRLWNWGDRGQLRELLGAETEITEHALSFTGTSPGAWVLEQAEFHPAWQATRELLPPERFEELLDELIELLERANTDPGGLRFSGEYAVARARV